MRRAIGTKSVVAIMAVLAAGGWWWLHSGSDKNANQKPPVPVSVAAVKLQDVPLTLHDVGTVVTYQSVAIRSRLDSQITQVNFHDGDYVQKGQLLFVLDERQLKADRARDAAQLENLRRQFIRAKELAAKGYVAQADLDAAKAAYESQQAAVASLQTQLEYARILAPISGRTGTIGITVGNTVKNNDAPLVTINQVKPIRVQVSLPQHNLQAVRDAMARGKVTVEALPEGSTAGPARGTLEYIDNAVDQSTGTFAARASFPNDDEKLWPGMFVTFALMLGDEKGVLTVPEIAVQHGQDGDYAFVLAGGKAAKRTIKVERIENGTAIVASGLKAGEQVAIDGMMMLADGAAVSVKK